MRVIYDDYVAHKIDNAILDAGLTGVTIRRIEVSGSEMQNLLESCARDKPDLTSFDPVTVTTYKGIPIEIKEGS